MCALAAAPLLAVLTRACTRANRGEVCVTGNKVASDFLLGHYGRIANVEWKPEGYDLVRFGSPGAWLRHYDAPRAGAVRDDRRPGQPCRGLALDRRAPG